jgi:hypothetical protein
MREERGPAITYPQCTDPRLQCPRVIRLEGVLYECQRIKHDQGIHDAGCRHTDGFLVRW